MQTSPRCTITRSVKAIGVSDRASEHSIPGPLEWMPSPKWLLVAALFRWNKTPEGREEGSWHSRFHELRSFKCWVCGEDCGRICTLPRELFGWKNSFFLSLLMERRVGWLKDKPKKFQDGLWRLSSLDHIKGGSYKKICLLTILLKVTVTQLCLTNLFG